MVQVIRNSTVNRLRIPGSVTTLNGQSGAVSLTSTGGTVTITTPTSSTINLEASSGGTPGGSNTQLQYNNAGAFGGTAAAVYSPTGTHVTISGLNSGDIPLSLKANASGAGDILQLYGSSGAINTTGGAKFNTDSQFLGKNGASGSPTYSFTGSTSTGMYRSSSGLFFSISGTDRVFLNTVSFVGIPSDGAYTFSSTTAASGTPDVGAFRSAAGILQITNGLAISSGGLPGAILCGQPTSSIVGLDIIGNASASVDIFQVHKGAAKNVWVTSSGVLACTNQEVYDAGGATIRMAYGASASGVKLQSTYSIQWSNGTSGVFSDANDTSLTRSTNGGVAVATIAGTGTKDPTLTVTGPAHTALTASTENIGANLNFSATKQFATGALTTQREVLVQAPTYSAVGATTITTAATLAITGAPIAGSNVTITNPIAARFTAGFSGATALELVAGSSSNSSAFALQIRRADGTVSLQFKDNQQLVIPTGGGIAVDSIQDASNNRVRLNFNTGVAGTLRQHNFVTALGGSIYQLAGLSSTSTERVQGEINASWADSTDATRKARVLYYAYDTAARECVRMEASGSAAMLGFFGASAVVQPANTVAIDTALTNLGLRASGGVANFNTDVKISTLGKALYIAEGSGGFSGSATLVLGTVAITIAGLTTADRAYVQRTVAGGTAGTGGLLAVCTANTLTITSIIIAGTIQALDTATVNYFITRPA